jgi:tetratricopeptide (TPR) repeat protein
MLWFSKTRLQRLIAAGCGFCFVATVIFSDQVAAQEDDDDEVTEGGEVSKEEPATAAATDGSPQIVDHSQTSFAVYRGDNFTVEVKVLGEDLQMKWIYAKEVICRTVTCSIDTASWDLGTGYLSFVTYNKKGSKFLRFRVRVLAPPEGYAPNRVQPDTVNEEVSEDQVTDGDLQVYTMKGRGFSYHRKKLQVVGPLPRSLEWKESLKTQKKTFMRFGRRGSEMHILGPQSQVRLKGTLAGRRALDLEKGSIRSRNLGNSQPRWSILVGDKWQIDPDVLGDVLVARGTGENPKVTLTVLRGQARVFVREEGAAGNGAKNDMVLPGKAFAVPQGVSVILPNASESHLVKFELPRAKSTGGFIINSTPEYVSSTGDFQSGKADGVLTNKTSIEYLESLTLAKQANAAGDHFVAIELLLPYLERVNKSYEASLAMGEAYKGIFVNSAALKFFKQAQAVDEREPAPLFFQGELAMTEFKWQEAIDFLKKAEDLDYPDEQTLNYYLGVAHFHLGERVAAKSAMSYSLWNQNDPTSNPSTTSSAKKFYNELNRFGWFDVRFAAGILTDNNILRMASANENSLPEGVVANSGTGYIGHAGFSVYPWRGDRGSFGLFFDIEKNGWLNASLKTLETIHQDLGLQLSLHFGQDNRRRPWFELNAVSKVAMIFVGEERAADQLVSHFSLGSPAFFDASIFARTVNLVDPLPGRDDVLDPTLWEVVEVSDRSNSQVSQGVGISPIDGENFSLRLSYEAGVVQFKDDFSKLDSYDSKLMGVLLTYHPGIRGDLGLGVDSLNRDFTESLDQRKDTRLSYSLGWKWHFTPSLSQLISGTVDKHKSSRDDMDYVKRVIGYRINLDF